MATIYVFEGKIVRAMKRYIVYPPKEYQEKFTETSREES